MRHVLSLVPLLSLACAAATVEAQSPDPDDPPPAVLAAFAERYPGEESPDWEVDRNGNYEAQFKQRGQKLRADFTPAGVWVETEMSLKWKDLPGAVQDAIEDEYDRDDIVELEYTHNAEKGRFYDVEIDPKGEKKFDVEYRGDGKRL